jgi:hypothetical protein
VTHRTTAPVSAVYRPNRRRDWEDVEIVGRHVPTDQLVLREVGKFWPGVFLAPREDVRISGREFYLGSTK